LGVAPVTHGTAAGELPAEVILAEVRVDGLLLLKVAELFGMFAATGASVGEVREGAVDGRHRQRDVRRSWGREGLKILWDGGEGVSPPPLQAGRPG
jgi:hypothetical protein